MDTQAGIFANIMCAICFCKADKRVGTAQRFLAVLKADKTREGVVADYKNFGVQGEWNNT